MPKLDALVFQNSRGQNLVGVVHHGSGEGPRPCLIICHGYAGTKIGGSRRFVEFGRYAAEQNLTVLRFDFAGSGDSEGSLIDLTLDNELDDLRAAIEAAKKLDSIDPNRIGVVGHCMGGVTAIRASARLPEIYRTVAWAPFTDLGDSLEKTIGEDAFSVISEGEVADFLYNEQLFQSGPDILTYSKDLDVFAEISEVRQPLLVIHGTEDAMVPLDEAIKLMDHAKQFPGEKKLEILEGAHHSFPYHQEELFELTVGWFK